MLRDKIAQDLVEQELFYTDVFLNGERTPVYVAVGFDREKMEAPGSLWFVYKSDACREYYKRNEERIDDMVDEILEDALDKRRIDN